MASDADKPRRRAQRRRAPSQKQRFTHGVTRWLARAGYDVGLPEDDLALTAATDELKGAVALAGAVVHGLSLSWLISSEGNVERITEVLEPYAERADVLGFKVDLGVLLVPVVFTDDLTVGEVRSRLHDFAEHAPPAGKIGARLLGTNAGVAVAPLLVYFDPARFAEDTEQLQEGGFRHVAGGNVKAHFVDVANEQVAVSEPRGLFSGALIQIGEALNRLSGAEEEIFDRDKLQRVMKLGQELEPKS
jgi:hypothetical protein